MKYKNFLFGIASLFAIIVNAQQAKFCGKVDYTFTTNLAYLYSEKYTMNFNSTYSYCEEKVEVKINDKNSQEKSEQGVTNKHIVDRQNLKSKFFFNNGSHLYFRDNFMDEILLVKEDAIEWNWILHPETKQIANFTSKKATTTFRGRNYTAWYITNIPIPFGPWKFHGLPGLILEVYDASLSFHIMANNVKIDNSPCIIKIDAVDLKKAINIEDYLLKKDKILDEFLAEMSSRLPKGSEPLRWDKNCSGCHSNQIENFND